MLTWMPQLSDHLVSPDQLLIIKNNQCYFTKPGPIFRQNFQSYRPPSWHPFDKSSISIEQASAGLQTNIFGFAKHSPFLKYLLAALRQVGSQTFYILWYSSFVLLFLTFCDISLSLWASLPLSTAVHYTQKSCWIDPPNLLLSQGKLPSPIGDFVPYWAGVCDRGHPAVSLQQPVVCDGLGLCGGLRLQSGDSDGPPWFTLG